MYKYFSEKNTTDWVSALPKFLHAINNSVSRATGMKPSAVNGKNAGKLWEKLYGKHLEQTPIKPRFMTGDAVRIPKPNPIFDTGYFPSRSDHIYAVEEGIGMKPEYYMLKNASGHAIKRRFYLPELVKTKLDEQTTYRVEKILKERIRRGVKESLVKFIDYPEHYWLKDTDFVK